ncbi:MAG: hypothetical protein ACRDJH_14295 [Thermomicrobiales bacterium]
MPLFPDATALIALGKANLLHLLPTYAEPVSIGPRVRAEVIRSARQVDAAIATHAIRVVEVDPADVFALETWLSLDTGEAEVIALAAQRGGNHPHVLVDENHAFRVIRLAFPGFRVSCLAHVLHAFEAAGTITAAESVLRVLLADGSYGWARQVRQDYERWCLDHGIAPLPIHSDET